LTKPSQSAIVVLVPQAETLVQLVRQRYGLAPAQVPAHITVLAPFKPPDEISSAVVADLRRLFARFRPFRFSLSALGTFPDTLYLVPAPGEPFIELTRAVYEQFPETPPYEGAFDGIVPHLTLVHVSDGFPFEKMVKGTESVLRARLPVQVKATEIALLDNSCGEWCVHTMFALGD
jgi:2'-5' RNA ligase